MASPQRKLRFIDVGINLTDPRYHGKRRFRGKKMCSDLSSVMQRASDNGVGSMLITGDNAHGSKEAIALAKEWGQFATVGCHPTRATEFESNASTPDAYLDSLRKLIANNLDVVAAVGECGLDYDREMFCDGALQRKYFPLHFTLAEEFRLPLFLHSRNTGADFTNIMRENSHRLSTGGVVHSFCGTAVEAMAMLDLGFYIGLNGCSMKTKENLHVCASIPLDRIVLETDGPWCEIRPSHASYALLWPTVAGATAGGAVAPQSDRGAVGAATASTAVSSGAQAGGSTAGEGKPDCALSTGGKKEEETKREALGPLRTINGPMNSMEAALLSDLLLPLPPMVKADRFEMGKILKGRNEPCMIRQVFQVLYTLRRHEVADPIELCDMIVDNTMRAFPKMMRYKPASSVPPTSVEDPRAGV